MRLMNKILMGYESDIKLSEINGKKGKKFVSNLIRFLCNTIYKQVIQLTINTLNLRR